MKSRGVYETPGGTILYAAHEKLEEITLDKDTAHFKKQVALKFAEICITGKWYTPLTKALSSFVDETQKTVTMEMSNLNYIKEISFLKCRTSPYII